MLRGGKPEGMLLDLGDTSPQICEESRPRSTSAYAHIAKCNDIHSASAGTRHREAGRDSRRATQGYDTIFGQHLLATLLERALSISLCSIRIWPIRFWHEPLHGRAPVSWPELAVKIGHVAKGDVRAVI